eukprot:Rhum_TRINITY_DN14524_c14_g1::Rhum_TRINITY_DN14524_c14_g1_i1::g.96708::m.96708
MARTSPLMGAATATTALLVALAATTPAVSGHTGCLKSQLPFDLDLVNTIEREKNWIVHLAGEYRVDGGPGDELNATSGWTRHTMNLAVVEEDTLVRIAVSNEPGLEVRLEVWEEDWLKHSREASSTERHLFTIVAANHAYKIVFHYRVLGTDVHCPTAFVEMAVAPQKVAEGELQKQFCRDDDDQDDIDLDVVGKLRRTNPGVLVGNTDEVKTVGDLESLRLSQSFTGAILGSHDTNSFFPLTNGLTDRDYIEISLPRLRGRRSEWLLKVEITTEFILAGGLSAVVTSSDFSYDRQKCERSLGDVTVVAPLEECMLANTADAPKLVASGKRGAFKNTYVLQTILSSRSTEDGAFNMGTNRYKLWVFLKEHFFAGATVDKCASYRVKVTLSPVDELEDKVNCDVTPLPQDLHKLPAYYDTHTHVMQFYERTAVNKKTGAHWTYFTPDVDSLLRVYVEHPTAELTVLLKKVGNTDTAHNGELLASTQAQRFSPRGLAYKLEAHMNYTVFFGESTTYYPTNDEDENEFVPFCDSFLVRMESFPLDQIGTPSEQAKTVVPLDFSGLQKPERRMSFFTITESVAERNASAAVAGDTKAELAKFLEKFEGTDRRQYAFTKKLVASADNLNYYWKQQVLQTFNFKVEVESIFKLTIERDFAAGDVVAQLQYTEDGPDGDDDPFLQAQVSPENFVYSTNDLRANKLDTELPPGTYTLRLMSSYVQDVSLDAAQSVGPIGPASVDYSLDLTIFPVDAAYTKEAIDKGEGALFSEYMCEGLRTLPQVLKVGHMNVQHIFERFALPYGRSNQFVYFEGPKDGEVSVDGVLHVQISDTEIGGSLKLYKRLPTGGGVGGTDILAEKGWVEVTAAATDESPEAMVEDLYTGLPWMMAKVSGDATYALVFTFEEESQMCDAFTLQLSVSPNRAETISGACKEMLPPEDLLANPTYPVAYENIHSYSGTSNIDHKHIHFKVDKAVEFMVAVSYDFKFQHIYLDVCKCIDPEFKECHSCGNIRGAAVYNGERIKTQMLSPGFYILKVYESVITKVVSRNICEKFLLDIQMDLVNRPSTNLPPSHDCRHVYLPDSFNIPGFIGRDGEQFPFHTLGDVRIDNRYRTDMTRFTVRKESLFKSFIPDTYDIPQVVVHTSVFEAKNDQEVAYAREGSTLEVLLQPGEYYLSLEYAEGSANMPSELDHLIHNHHRDLWCAAVPIEVSLLESATYVADHLDVGCDEDTAFPVTLTEETTVHARVTRRRRIPSDFARMVEFKLGPKGGRAELDLRSTFETGSLHMHLMKRDDEVLDHMQWLHYYPQRYMDRDYLFVELPEGDYEIHFHNTSSGVAMSGLSACQLYNLHLSIDDYSITQPPSPPDATPSPDGLVPITEPPSGSVCIEGEPFPEGMHTHTGEESRLYEKNEFAFKSLGETGGEYNLPSLDPKTLVRVFTHTHNQNAKVQLSLNSKFGLLDSWVPRPGGGSSAHVRSLLHYFEYENEGAIAKVKTSSDILKAQYIEGVDYTSCDELKALTTFDFAVAVMSREQVEAAVSKRRCASSDVTTVAIQDDKGGFLNPSLVETFTIGSNGVSASKKYAFDAGSFGKLIEYRLVVEEGSRVDLSAVVRFNFVISALRMQLFNATESGRAASSPIITEEAELDLLAGAEFDASTQLRVAALYPGTYSLQLSNQEGTELDTFHHLMPAHFCVPFTLELQGTQFDLPAGSTPVEATPAITALQPLKASRLLPTAPLEVSLSFTEVVNPDVTKEVLMKCKCRDDSLDVCKKPDTASRFATRSEDTSYDLIMHNIRELEQGLSWRLEFSESDAQPLRWGSDCTLHIPDGTFRTVSGDAFVNKVRCPAGGCVYSISSGACKDQSFCFQGGKCPFQESPSDPECRFCPDELPPLDGSCPVKVRPTPIPVSKPPRTLAPHPATPVPTPQPTVKPTHAPQTKAPTTSVPPTSPPGPVATSVPTPKPTPKPSAKPISTLPPNYHAETGAPSATIPGSSGGGGGGVVVIVILVVVAVLAGAIFYAKKAGHLSKLMPSTFRIPYHPVETEMEDDEDLFGDDDDAEAVPAA